MRLLTVPNWSFGRDKALLRRFRDTLESRNLLVHFCESDLDHNRTVTAFSGAPDLVADTVLDLCDFALPAIDLQRHMGVHPRIGALDVCPFVPLPSWDGKPDSETVERIVDRVSSVLAEKFGVPVFLYEKSERGRHETDLPALRKGGFGGLLDRKLDPDYGPGQADPHLGVAVVGERDFLIAFNVNLEPMDKVAVKAVADEIRRLRNEADPRFLGVRPLGFVLASREMSQVSLNATFPDLTPIDPIVEFIRMEGSKHGFALHSTELIGVIRERDLAGASRLVVRPEQVVDGEPDDVKI